MSDGAAAAPIKAAGLAGPDAAAGGAGAVQIRVMALPEVFGGNEVTQPVWCGPMRCRLAAFRLCVVDFCAAAQFYIVPRTVVFTTCTRLNTGLRLQRGHPTAAFRALAQSLDLLGVFRTN